MCVCVCVYESVFGPCGDDFWGTQRRWRIFMSFLFLRDESHAHTKPCASPFSPLVIILLHARVRGTFHKPQPLFHYTVAAAQSKMVANRVDDSRGSPNDFPLLGMGPLESPRTISFRTHSLHITARSGSSLSQRGHSVTPQLYGFSIDRKSVV